MATVIPGAPSSCAAPWPERNAYWIWPAFRAAIRAFSVRTLKTIPSRYGSDVPVVGVPRVDDPVLGHVLDELERPGADSLILRFSCSASPFGMIPDARIPANEPPRRVGASRFICTVKGSTTLISLIDFSQEIQGDAVFGSRTRSMLYLTSSALMVWPLWNFTFGRSLKCRSCRRS